VTSRPAAAAHLHDLARLRRVRDRIDREYAQPLTLDLWSADWKVKAGHRIAVRVTDANTDW
jgi:hypothetical protein